MILHTEKIKNHFNSFSNERDKWLDKSRYFHSEDLMFYKSLISSKSSVLEIGCGNGQLIGSLNVQKAVGVDISDKLVSLAKKRFSHCQFYCTSLEKINSITEKLPKFDFIILSDTVGYFEDIQKNLNFLHKICSSNTRIIISYFSAFWSPLLNLSIGLKLKMPDLNPPLFSNSDLKSFLKISNYETIKVEKKIIMPFRFFGIEKFFNRILANLPLINHLNLRQYLIARSLRVKKEKLDSVSIIIPCKNESGNINNCLNRIPKFCDNIEIIFVEGDSSDDTWKKINDLKIKQGTNLFFKIKAFKQPSKGKKDAVLKGFSEAKNKVLMILDCDMTVRPEDLSKFWNAISSDNAEFVNGTRLIYPMKKNAMQFLNYIANKTFSHLFSWILGQRFTDTLCGTKVISKSNFERLKIESGDFYKLDPFGDFYLIFGANKLNLKVQEIPVRYHSRQFGETQISRFKDGYKLLKLVAFGFFKFKIIALKKYF